MNLVKERASFVADFWTIASYLFIAPSDFEAFGVKAGAESEKPADPRKAADPRAKVYDDAATAPYLAKDVDKFWKPENSSLALEAGRHMMEWSASADWNKENIEQELEAFIKGNEWPMGKVMNCLRLLLTGASSGLGIADILSFIGAEQFCSRMEAASAKLG